MGAYNYAKIGDLWQLSCLLVFRLARQRSATVMLNLPKAPQLGPGAVGSHSYYLSGKHYKTIHTVCTHNYFVSCWRDNPHALTPRLETQSANLNQGEKVCSRRTFTTFFCSSLASLPSSCYQPPFSVTRSFFQGSSHVDARQSHFTSISQN